MSATKAHTLGQKHVTRWALAADPLVFAASRAAWNGWTLQDRAIVRQAAIDAGRREFDLARQATEAAAGVIGKDLRGAGVVMTRLTPEELAHLAAAAKPVADKWTSEIGPDLVRRAQQAMAAARKP
jgi:TRAP-type C4-dicarboxylate transport system substrate-binding protein